MNICAYSDHFILGSPATLFDSTNPDWVLSLKLRYEGESSTAAMQVGQVSARHSRAISRSRKRTITEVDEIPDPELADVDIETPDNESVTQTNLTMADIHSCQPSWNGRESPSALSLVPPVSWSGLNPNNVPELTLT